jgi:enoyl-CoA hydratase/carnithine racemase
MEDMEKRLNDPDIISGVRDTGGRVTLAIYDCKKPVIAAINGAAVGIGATMTCAMDIRLASENTRIGFVFNKIGITPEACSTWFLPRIVGVSQALEWCYTADIIGPEEALSAGLVKSVLPADELLAGAYRIAEKIAQHCPVAIALTRQMMYRNAAAPHPIEAHKVDSLAIFYASLSSGKEGVQSFREKRAANFTDKCSVNMPPFYPWWDQSES